MDAEAARWALWSVLSTLHYLASSDNEMCMPLPEEEPTACTIDSRAIGHSLVVKEAVTLRSKSSVSRPAAISAPAQKTEETIVVYDIPETTKFTPHTRSEKNLLSLLAAREASQHSSSAVYYDDTSTKVVRKRPERPSSAVAWRVADSPARVRPATANKKRAPPEPATFFQAAEADATTGTNTTLLRPSEISPGVTMRTNDGKEVRGVPPFGKDVRRRRDLNPPAMPVPSRRTPRTLKDVVVVEQKRDDEKQIVVTAARDLAAARLDCRSCCWDLDGHKRIPTHSDDDWRVVMYGNAEPPVPLDLPLLPF